MKNFNHKSNQVLSGMCGWLMLAMMSLLVIDIIGRTVNHPLQGMSELSVFVMMIVIYLGFSRCEEHREHVGLEVVVNFLPPKGKRIASLLKHIMAVIAVGLLFYAVTTDAWAAYEHNASLEGTMEIPIWPVKCIMVVGMAFFFIQSIINLIADARQGNDSVE